MADAFRMHITQTKELGTCPVQQIGGCFFFYMRISNAYIVTVVSSRYVAKSHFGGVFDEDARFFMAVPPILDNTLVCVLKVWFMIIFY
ncbi:hypothetical protein AAG906_028392 [Vitis piasezkii]